MANNASHGGTNANDSFTDTCASYEPGPAPGSCKNDGQPPSRH